MGGTQMVNCGLECCNDFLNYWDKCQLEDISLHVSYSKIRV